MFGWGSKKTKTPEAPPRGEARPGKAAPAVEEPSADLKVKVAERRACALTLSVQVPARRVEEATEESFRRLQGQVRIPGFRPGKAPLDLVRKNYEGTAREDALDRLLRRSVQEAIKQEKLEPVSVPVVDKIQYDLNKPLTFDVKVECAPDVKLKDYKGLPLTRKVKTFTDADIEKKLEDLRETNAKLAEAPEAAVGDRHFVVVDYEGTVDGKPVAGGTAKEQLIDMSAPQTLAGFTEGLRGARAGEVRDVQVTFPGDHFDKALAGKAALFKVTVSAVKEKKLPALDDEFAKDVGCKDLADLKERVRKNAEAEFAQGVRRDLEKQVADRLLEEHAFDVPPSLAEERARDLTRHLKDHLLRQGASEEDWKANEEKMLAKNRAEAERQVRLSYLLTWVREAEKIEVTDAELEETLRKSEGAVDASRRESLRKWMEGRRDALRAQLTEERIFSFLIDNAKIVEREESGA